MAELQADISLDGLDSLLIQGLSFTLTHGIAAGIISITIAPPEKFNGAGGTLKISFGDTKLSFPEIKLDSVEGEYTSSGYVWRLTFLDRRWKWKFGQIIGRYNIVAGDDDTVGGKTRSERASKPTEIKFVDGTEKTPKELCELCLKAMKERGYDVSKVPNDSRPTVEWDYENPAEALASLADQLGCRVVLRLDNTVAILPVGEGAELPRNDSISSESLTIDPPEKPDSLTVVCGRTVIQADLLLEAVGTNLDSHVVLIEDLDYQPDDGWDKVDVEHFNAVSDKKAREIAKSCVFRHYRVKESELTSHLTKLNSMTIEKLWHILPLNDVQLEMTAGDDAIQRPKPAAVFGKFFDPEKTTSLSANDGNNVEKLKPLGDGTSDNDKALLYAGDFSIDARSGIVKFSKPVYKLDADGYKKPAELILRTSFSVQDADTRVPIRYEHSRKTGGKAGTEAQLFKDDGLALKRTYSYTDSYSVKSFDENKDDLIKNCDAKLDAAEKTFEISSPQSIAYVGILKIDLDGAVQTVSWEITLSGCITKASRNTDRRVEVPTYAEMRFRQQLARLAKNPPNERAIAKAARRR